MKKWIVLWIVLIPVIPFSDGIPAQNTEESNPLTFLTSIFPKALEKYNDSVEAILNGYPQNHDSFDDKIKQAKTELQKKACAKKSGFRASGAILCTFDEIQGMAKKICSDFLGFNQSWCSSRFVGLSKLFHPRKRKKLKAEIDKKSTSSLKNDEKDFRVQYKRYTENEKFLKVHREEKNLLVILFNGNINRIKELIELYEMIRETTTSINKEKEFEKIKSTMSLITDIKLIQYTQDGIDILNFFKEDDNDYEKLELTEEERKNPSLMFRVQEMGYLIEKDKYIQKFLQDIRLQRGLEKSQNSGNTYKNLSTFIDTVNQRFSQ